MDDNLYIDWFIISRNADLYSINLVLFDSYLDAFKLANTNKDLLVIPLSFKNVATNISLLPLSYFVVSSVVFYKKELWWLVRVLVDPFIFN